MLPSTDAWKVDTTVILFQIHDEIRTKKPSGTGDGLSKNNTGPSPLLITVDLSSLVALGSIQLINISALPINALLLSTDSGYYVTAAVYEKLKGAGADVGTHSRVVASYDDSENDAAESSGEMRSKMDATMCSIEGLRVRATESLQNMDATRRQILRQSKLAALEKVRSTHLDNTRLLFVPSEYPLGTLLVPSLYPLRSLIPFCLRSCAPFLVRFYYLST